MTGRRSKMCGRFAVLLRRLFWSQDTKLVKCLHMWGDEKQEGRTMQNTFGSLEAICRQATNQMRSSSRANNLTWASCILYREAIKMTNSLCLVLHRRTRHGPHPCLIYSFIYSYTFSHSFTEWQQGNSTQTFIKAAERRIIYIHQMESNARRRLLRASCTSPPVQQEAAETQSLLALPAVEPRPPLHAASVSTRTN